MNWVASIKLQVKAGMDILELRNQISDIMLTNVTREEILAGLNELSAEFRDFNDDDAEDVINDLQDFLVGWCRPDLRL